MPVQPATIRFDHIAIAVPDPSKLTPLLVGELGGAPYGAGPGGGFRWFQWEFRGGGILEILEPAGPPDGFLHRFLHARGAGVHHVTFKVPDLGEALGRARSLGYEAVGVDDASPTWKEAFLHPKQALGIVVQIVESAESEGRDGGGDGAFEWLDFPAAPPPAANPAELVGLLCNAHSESAARRQWQSLLGADGRARDGAIVFSWPDSPMRIQCRFDASRPEGPVALELGLPSDAAGGTNASIPEGPHPLLGTALLPVADADRP